MAKTNQSSKKKKAFLGVPIEQFRIDPNITADEIMRRMERISFQGRNLALAHRIWKQMLADDVLIFLGVAGAVSAGGLRLAIAHLIERRAVDCLVSTGANLYHDLHETRGRKHFVGSPAVDDRALQEAHIDRVYDTFVDEDEFIENDIWLSDFAGTLEARGYTTREFLFRLGEHLWNETGADGILTAAYRSNVPIFCPAIADSSIGMGISQARHNRSELGNIDVIGDIIESANLVVHNPRTASIVLGGGTPKNFINQASVQAAYYCPGIAGHQYALQIVTDVPNFGGASGSTLSEARSWGKLASDADQITVHADATLAFPLLTSALITSSSTLLDERRTVKFDLRGEALVANGSAMPVSRFSVSN